MPEQEHANPKPEDFELLPYRALLDVSRLMTEQQNLGKHSRDGWKNKPPRFHVARGLRHGVRWMISGETEDLRHAATRFHMALEMVLEKP